MTMADRVFITGGTGYIGAAVVQDLVAHGHAVTGLARSEASRQRLAELGATPLGGDLEDASALARGAQGADAVIHLAFVHNFADFAAAADADARAITALGEALAHTGKPFLVTSGVPSAVDGHVITESDDPDGRMPRRSEAAALPFASQGVRVSLVRPSRFVYGDGPGGFITQLIAIARAAGVSAYVDDGANHIHAGHRADTAELYRLALDHGEAGAKYQAVGDAAVPFRDVAEAIADRLGLPTSSITPSHAADHFGFLGPIVAAENPASSEATRKALGWNPTRPSLVEDLRHGFGWAFGADA
jgi:nucleoside-diphosphate-sugar epimerase